MIERAAEKVRPLRNLRFALKFKRDFAPKMNRIAIELHFTRVLRKADVVVAIAKVDNATNNPWTVPSAFPRTR